MQEDAIATRLRELQQEVTKLTPDVDSTKRDLETKQRNLEQKKKELDEIQKLYGQIAGGAGEALKARQVSEPVLDRAQRFRTQLGKDYPDLEAQITAIGNRAKEAVQAAEKTRNQREQECQQAEEQLKACEQALAAAQQKAKEDDAALKSALADLTQLGKRILEAHALVVKRQSELESAATAGADVARIARLAIDFDAAFKTLQDCSKPDKEAQLITAIDTQRQALLAAPEREKKARAALDAAKQAEARAREQLKVAEVELQKTDQAQYDIPPPAASAERAVGAASETAGA